MRACDQTGFKSKKIRVNLNLPIKSETKAETTEVLKIVDEDRKYVIQATIVRCVLFRVLVSMTQSYCIHLQDNESSEDDEKPSTHSRSHHPAVTKICT